MAKRERHRREPHPNSIAANLDKLTEKQRELYDKNIRNAADDAAHMESWARYTTGGKTSGLSQNPQTNDHTPVARRSAIPSKDRSEQ